MGLSPDYLGRAEGVGHGGGARVLASELPLEVLEAQVHPVNAVSIAERERELIEPLGDRAHALGLGLEGAEPVLGRRVAIDYIR